MLLNFPEFRGLEHWEFKPNVIDKFIAWRLAAGVSPATINGHLRVLRSALNRAEDEQGRQAQYPMPKIRLLKVEKKLPSVLSPAEVIKLRTAAAPHRFVASAIDLGLMAGLRHQEILHLTWGDVDDNQVLIRGKDGWTPKNHTERAIPMHPDLSYTLFGCAVWPHRNRKSPEGPNWIFRANDGSRLRDIGRQVRGVFEVAGLYDRLRKPGLHMLRRTWATELAEHTDLETLRQLGGWSDLAVMQRYITTNDERRDGAIKALNYGVIL